LTLTRSTAEARCLSLAAQGFGEPRKVNAPGWRDLGERVIRRTTRVAPTPTEADAMRALVQIAARALGVATAAD